MFKEFFEARRLKAEAAKLDREIIIRQIDAQRQVLESYKRDQDFRNVMEDAFDTDSDYPSRSPNSIMPGPVAHRSAFLGARRDGDYPPYYQSEQEHDQIREAARFIEAYCPTAQIVLEQLANYTIGTGFDYEVSVKRDVEGQDDSVDNTETSTEDTPVGASPDLPSPSEIQEASEPPQPVQTQDELKESPSDQPPPPGGEEGDTPPMGLVDTPPEGGITQNYEELVLEVQKVIDEFVTREQWWDLEVELFRREVRDGEYILVYEDLGMGDTHVRVVEPEQMRAPQDIRARNTDLGVKGNKSWKYGILANKDDSSKIEQYWIATNIAENQSLSRNYYPDEIKHVKSPWIDRTARRGVSEFFANGDDAVMVRSMLRNLATGATAQASITFIREMATSQQPSSTGGIGNFAASNRGDNTRRSVGIDFSRPQVIDITSGMKYIPGPLGGTKSPILEVLQSCLRSIGTRWSLPEGMISGDASNANFASALVAEGPFNRNMQRRQARCKYHYSEIIKKVVELAAMAGRFSSLGVSPEAIWEVLELNCEAPPIISRDPDKETERNDKLNKAGILSLKTWSSREDLDWDVEQRQIEEDKPKQLEDPLGLMGPTSPDGSSNPLDPAMAQIASDRGDMIDPTTQSTSKRQKRKWVSYIGKEGSRGWKDTYTGDVTYTDNKPKDVQ